MLEVSKKRGKYLALLEVKIFQRVSSLINLHYHFFFILPFSSFPSPRRHFEENLLFRNNIKESFVLSSAEMF